MSMILGKVSLQDRRDIISLRDGNCCPIELLPTATEIYDTDYLMLSQNGILHKITIGALKLLFGIQPTTDYSVLFDGEAVLFNGEVVTYTDIIPSNIVMQNGTPIQYLG